MGLWDSVKGWVIAEALSEILPYAQMGAVACTYMGFGVVVFAACRVAQIKTNIDYGFQEILGLLSPPPEDEDPDDEDPPTPPQPISSSSSSFSPNP